MPQSLVNESISGGAGSVTVVESAGKIVIGLQDSQLGGGLSESIQVSVGASVLLSAWAASTSNATLKSILAAAISAINALPA